MARHSVDADRCTVLQLHAFVVLGSSKVQVLRMEGPGVAMEPKTAEFWGSTEGSGY